LLEETGPSLGRPRADTLKGSTLTNDPRRTAILLLGGRKADRKRYTTAIPEAERIYQRYLREIRN
jgi:hypothetical protein